MIQTEGDANSLKFALPPDTYRVLIVNCDVNNVRFSSMQQLENAEISLHDAAEQQDIMPSPLYAVVVDSLTITPDHTLTLAVEPKPMVQQLKFNIHITNSESIRQCSASLSGLPPAILLKNRTRKDTARVTVPFSMEKTNTGFTRDLFVLDALNDMVAGGSGSHQLKVDFLMPNNRIVSSTVDLGFFLSATDRQNIVVDVNATIHPSASPSVTFSNWEVKPYVGNEIPNQL